MRTEGRTDLTERVKETGMLYLHLIYKIKTRGIELGGLMENTSGAG